MVGDGGAGASHLELNAAGVELGAAGGVDVVGRVGLVEGDDLLANEVPASGNVGWENKVLLALVGDEPVDGPELGRAVVAILGDLGPDGLGAVALGVGGDVRDDGPLVRPVDDVVAAGVVVPLKSQSVAGRGLDEGAGGIATVDVAGQGSAREVLDRAVVGRAADVDVPAVTLVDPVHPNAIDLGVGRGAADKSQGEGRSVEIHGFWKAERIVFK